MISVVTAVDNELNLSRVCKEDSIWLKNNNLRVMLKTLWTMCSVLKWINKLIIYYS
jgi:hypothetical protein